MHVLRPGTPEAAGLDPSRIDLIRHRAAEWIESRKHQCIVMLLARRGVICLHEAWGKLGPEADAPAAVSDSIFWMASNTKPLTATAILLLAEDGLLTINRRVVDYVPELRGTGAKNLTLRHLLTHTSGWNYDDAEVFIFTRMSEDGENSNLDGTEQYLISGYTMPLTKAPGSEMSYCNYNYTLLGEIVRRVSGQPFSDFLHERVFGPLGMTDSCLRESSELATRMARFDPAHPPDKGVIVDDAFHTILRDTYNGAWGLKSTARDYAVFVQMLLNGGSYGSARILHARTVAEMTRNQIPGIGTDFFGDWRPEASWGLGLRVLSHDRWPYFDGTITQPGVFMHGGAGGTEWWADPHHDLLGVYCSVCCDIDYDRREARMNFDLLQDMATAALID